MNMKKQYEREFHFKRPILTGMTLAGTGWLIIMIGWFIVSHWFTTEYGQLGCLFWSFLIGMPICCFGLYIVWDEFRVTWAEAKAEAEAKAKAKAEAEAKAKASKKQADDYADLLNSLKK